MPSIARRWLFGLAGFVFILYNLSSWRSSWRSSYPSYRGKKPVSATLTKWRKAQNVRWPLEEYKQLPPVPVASLPPIQGKSQPESAAEKAERMKRLEKVKETMKRSWQGYRKYAWLKDEVKPLSGGAADTFGGWAATLVDSLDTLWIMGLKGEFWEAVHAASEIDFGSSSQMVLNTFETTIRYLGGFLSAYDLSGEPILLEKAEELGNMLYVAFDTPNRMPVTRWHWQSGLSGQAQEAPMSAVLAEVASLSMEFTRLAQITGDNRFYDAIDRITQAMAQQQNSTLLPGLWPIASDLRSIDFISGNDFSIGAMADSAYEYLPKMHMLLGGGDLIYQKMYEQAVAAIRKHVIFRGMNEYNFETWFPGSARAIGSLRNGGKGSDSTVSWFMQHLSCYAGGMIGIGARVFDRPKEVEIAEGLTHGCVWAYESTPNGIMPETFNVMPCPPAEADPFCKWDEMAWLNASMAHGGATEAEEKGGLEGGRHYAKRMHLSPGITIYRDSRYLLRPEAIESVFIMHRLTGSGIWREKGWNMFNAVIKATQTDIAHAAVQDVMLEEITQIDNMESFWTAETLKYFYLLFSDDDVISLDEWVFNTEAHPFKRPVAKHK